MDAGCVPGALEGSAFRVGVLPVGAHLPEPRCLERAPGTGLSQGPSPYSEILPHLSASSCYSRITILVNRGFVPRKKVNPDTRQKGQVRGKNPPFL